MIVKFLKNVNGVLIEEEIVIDKIEEKAEKFEITTLFGKKIEIMFNDIFMFLPITIIKKGD